MNLPAHRTDKQRLATEMDKLQALASLAALPAPKSFSPEQDEVNDAAMMQALHGVTYYALSEAVKAILRGALNHTFFPSPVEMRRLCDAAQLPVDNMARRVRMTEAQARENAEFNRILASRTPESIARQQEVYRRFCEDHKTTKEAEDGPRLDPALVALVPDAPTTFKRP